MDIGPQNIFGQRPSLVDPIVMELISRLEPFIDNHADLEIEGRVGTVAAVAGPNAAKENASRLFLPILTETILEPSGSSIVQSGKPFKYEFVPDVGKDSFDRIQERMECLLSGKLSEEPPNPIFKISSKRETHTVDEIYKKPTPCRLTYDKSTYGIAEVDPTEVIVKDHVDRFDVWAGHYDDLQDEARVEEEGATRHPFDYRLSVNRERVLDTSILPTLNRADCTMVREKKRVTYEMKAWVVDMTQVTVLRQADGSGGRSAAGGDTKYEVEVELKRELLFEQLVRRRNKKHHGAYQILTDFLYFLRDLGFVFGPTGGVAAVRTVGGFKYPELSACDPSEEKKKKYREKVGSDIMPIIGDYIFQIIDQVK